MLNYQRVCWGFHVGMSHPWDVGMKPPISDGGLMDNSANLNHQEPLFYTRPGTLWQTNITMENHHFQWVNPLFLWSFSIAMLNYQRVNIQKSMENHHSWIV